MRFRDGSRDEPIDKEDVRMNVPLGGDFVSSCLSVTKPGREKASRQPSSNTEALTAVSVAALTLYDMCKAVDRGMVIEAIALEEKRGGASGVWLREAEPHA